MKKTAILSLCLLLVGIVTVSSAIAQAHSASTVERQRDFNFDWKFTEVNETSLPRQLPLDDSSWRNVRLPHDWSVEHSFSDKWEGATGYLPGGIGIYQKHFKTPASPNEKSTFILFDGVYNNATFWLNGQRLGENPYGYSPTYFELTPFLNTDGSDNVLTVHVDHSRYVDSRWYTGSGIYRNVKLVTVDKLHIPIWGTFLTTPEITEDRGKVNLAVKVQNDTDTNVEFVMTTKIVNEVGKAVATTQDSLKLATGMGQEFNQTVNVANPELWELDSPKLYTAVTTLTKNGKVVDHYETRFGFRTIEFDKDQGFFLNGKNTFMNGVSIHHDGGLVGAAVPKGVWKRRLQTLKEAGVNAIRVAHNPYSQEFLDLCDEMGLLVQNEFFDEFDYPKDKRLNKHERHDDYISRGYNMHFHKWGKSDLTRTMLRDRNHPSVVQWSIGNEIEWTYLNYREVTGFWNKAKDDVNDNFWGGAPKFDREEMKQRYLDSPKAEYILAETAQKLADWTRELDTTRPVTTNMIIPQVSLVSGYADAVDISGFSYRNVTIPWALKHFPDKHITINENPGSWNDLLQVYQYPGVFSQFMWTGIDYMGEHHNKWPKKSGWGDILDLAGFKKQGWNYFKSHWINKPHVSIGTMPLENSLFISDGVTAIAHPKGKRNNWSSIAQEMHWNYEEGEMVLVEVITNHSMAELFLNGESLGYRSMSDTPDRVLRWAVPFTAGTLTAKTGFEGQEVVAVMETTTQPVGFTLTADRKELKADGYDVAHLVVQLVDERGRPVKVEETHYTFEIQGNARLLGVDNGASDNIQDFQSNNLTSSQGRALAIIQSNREAGEVKVIVKAKGFAEQALTLNIQP